MPIGEKTRRIRIERRVEGGDGSGGLAITWALRAVVDARERALSGRESQQFAQLSAVLMSVWEVWYRTDIAVTDRFLLGSRTVEIHGTYDPDGRRRELFLLCGEVQGVPAATGSHEGWIDSQLGMD